MKRIARYSPMPMPVAFAVARYDELKQTLKKHLPPATVALFAKPKVLEGNDTIVEWYSDLSGHPVPIGQLPALQAQEVQRLLDERLQSILQLANHLETKGASGSSLSALLRVALLYPASSFVYSLNGQPVITCWGNAPNRQEQVVAVTTIAETVPTPAAVISEPPRKRRAGKLRWLLVLVFMLLLLFILAWWVLCYLPHKSKAAWVQSIANRLPDCQAVTGFKALCENKYGDPFLLARNQCPQQRPAEYAPELGIVLDASSSLQSTLPRLTDENSRHCNDYANGKVCKQTPMLRENAVKTLIDNVITQTPADVTISVVKASGCPGAIDLGNFRFDQREQLRQTLQAVHSEGGTPLGDAIALAGKALDGTRKDSTLLVVMNSKNSCGADPCEVAATLAKAKPHLKINVIDLLGTGAGNCLASATGGQVYTGNNAEDIVALSAQAVNLLTGPAHCPQPLPLPAREPENDTISMLGEWGSRGEEISINWNPDAKRYEGRILTVDAREKRFGFKRGEVIWVITPTASNTRWPAQIKQREMLNNVSSGKFVWKTDEFYLDKSSSQKISSREYMFPRLCEDKNAVMSTPEIPPCK